MNFRKIMKNTWATGLLLFSFLTINGHTSKTTEVVENATEEDATEPEQ